MYEQKSISNSNNFVVYFRYSLSFLYFLVYAYFVYWTSDSIVLASSTVAITMSVRKSDLVRSTSVWSLRPNEIFHRPSQHTSSVFVLWRRRNISRDLALHPRHYRLFSRGQMKTRVLYTSSLRDVHYMVASPSSDAFSESFPPFLLFVFCSFSTIFAKTQLQRTI